MHELVELGNLKDDPIRVCEMKSKILLLLARDGIPSIYP